MRNERILASTIVVSLVLGVALRSGDAMSQKTVNEQLTGASSGRQPDPNVWSESSGSCDI